MEPASTLYAARVGRDCIVRVTPRGTMQESPTFMAFMLRALEEPGCRAVVDLLSCQYLDSTFLGCLVALQKRYGRLNPPQFVAIADAAAQKRLLSATCLQRVLNLADRLPVEPHHLREVTICPPDSTEFLEHVCDCHRQLAETDSPKSGVFLGIVEEMQRELAN